MVPVDMKACIDVSIGPRLAPVDLYILSSISPFDGGCTCRLLIDLCIKLSRASILRNSRWTPTEHHRISLLQPEDSRTHTFALSHLRTLFLTVDSGCTVRVCEDTDRQTDRQSERDEKRRSSSSSSLYLWWRDVPGGERQHHHHHHVEESVCRAGDGGRR